MTGGFIVSPYLVTAGASAAAPTFVAVGTGAASTGTATVPLPVGLTTDDIMLLFVETANEALGTPAGWAHVTGSPAGHGTAGSVAATALHIFWKRHSGSESAPSLTAATDHWSADIIGVRGCKNSGNPWSDAQFDTGSVGATATCPAITPATANNLVVLTVSSGLDASFAGFGLAVNANLASITGVALQHSTLGNGGGVGAATGLPITGAGVSIGTSTVSLTSADWAAAAIAMTPT